MQVSASKEYCCIACKLSWLSPKCSIEIEVQYYEKEDEVLTKVESIVITAKDAPLKEVFRNTACIMEVSKDAGMLAQKVVTVASLQRTC